MKINSTTMELRKVRATNPQMTRRLINDVQDYQRRAVHTVPRRIQETHRHSPTTAKPKLVSDFTRSAPSITKSTAIQHQPVKPAPLPHPLAVHKSHSTATPPLEQKDNKQDPEKLTIAEHISEFRKRLLWSILALLSGGALGYAYHNEIVSLLVKPLNQQLYYTSPTGGFDFLIKTCLFFGFLLTVPIVVYNLLKFIAPAIPSHITYKTSKILVVSSCLAVAGVAFAYYVSLPAALHFLNNFSTGSVTSLISANEYFTFVMIYMAGFAALFQMPLILAFINKVTPLTPHLMMQKQRFVILGSFIVAAILTPTPDPVNQTLMAVPIIMLYQSSIGVVWHANKRTRKKRKMTYSPFMTALPA